MACARGTWTACDSPPALVHGIALISASGPNICLYGQGGKLRLQVGPNQYRCGEFAANQLHARHCTYRLSPPLHREVGQRRVLSAIRTDPSRPGLLPLAGGSRGGSRLARELRPAMVGRRPHRCAAAELGACLSIST